MTTFSDLEGKVLTGVEVEGTEEILFHTEGGSRYRMYHEQDCCEVVYIEDINGDLNDLVGQTIVSAKEESNSEDCDGESFTYTFYHIRTAHHDITIRWEGSSNGYYSESVDFDLID